MKILVSSKGEGLASDVDERFGRAPYFIIYDTDTENFETMANDRNMNAAQGAGIQAAQAVAAASADIVISGNIGPKAYQVLAASGIKTVLWAEGSVAQAIKLFRNNQIKVSDGASVEGHWM
jgi:predicted Fe-Mo cluster-binding NifX family protein